LDRHWRRHGSVRVGGHADGVVAAIDIGYRRDGLVVNSRGGHNTVAAIVIEMYRLLLKLRLIALLELLLLLLLLLVMHLRLLLLHVAAAPDGSWLLLMLLLLLLCCR